MRQFEKDEDLVEETRKPPHGSLRRAVGIQKPRSGNADIRVMIEMPGKL